MQLPLTPPNHKMLSYSSLVCLLAFASYHVSSAVVPNGEAVEQLVVGLFEVPNLPEGEKMIEDKDFDDEEEGRRLIEEAYEANGRRDVLLTAGWRRLRFRQPRKIPIPICPNGGRGPGPMIP